MRRNTVTLSVVFVMIFFCILFVPSNATAVYENSLALYFDDPKVKEVDVSPAANGTAVFSGILKVSAEVKMEVSLSVTVEGEGTENWGASITPSFIECWSGTHDISVYVAVKAPPETDHKIHGEIIVDVKGLSWSPGTPYFYAHSSLLVNVNPYYKFSITSSTPYKEIGPHAFTTLDIGVRNFGNTKVNDLVISIENEDDLDGWMLLLPASGLDIEGRESKIVSIKVETPRDWTLWEDDVQRIVIKVESETAGTSETYTMYISQKGTYIPGFDPMFTIIILSMIAIVLRKVKKC